MAKDTPHSQGEEQQEASALAQAFSGSSPAERERLARIVDLLPCYVVLIDKDCRIRFHNKAFTEFFGAANEATCHKVLRGLDSPCQFCPPLDVVKGNTTCVMEWVYPKNNHAFRVYSYPFEETDGSLCVLKVGFNITASVRVQQALDLSEQSYRAITDNLSIGIALLDPQMRIKTGNSRLGQWFGQGFQQERHVCELLQCTGFRAKQALLQTSPQPVGQKMEHAESLSGALPADDAEKAPAPPLVHSGEHGQYCPDCPFQAAIQDGASHEKEFAVTFQDGKERIVRLVACPVKPSKGTPRTNSVRALIMMLEDITNRLRVNQQLQRARKLEAMGTLAGGIAHEINQPLSALHLYASGLQMLMEKQGSLTPEITQERLTLIMREADKIRSIISHMRTLVMQEGAVPIGAVSIAHVVSSAVSIMSNQFATRGIDVQVRVPDNLPCVRSNAVQLEQVLVNLLGNAVHALDSDAAQHGDGSTLRCINIQTAVNAEGTRVRLEVADSGPGLPKGSEHIFDPFYTTKERHEGMGLGLSIVHGLVSLWGGEVSASPRHPQLGGAAFYVELDIAECSSEQPEEGTVSLHLDNSEPYSKQ